MSKAEKNQIPNPNRRDFLKVGALTAANTALYLFGPQLPFFADLLFSNPELSKEEMYTLGGRVGNWEFPTGKKARDIIPGVEAAATVIQQYARIGPSKGDVITSLTVRRLSEVPQGAGAFTIRGEMVSSEDPRFPRIIRTHISSGRRLRLPVVISPKAVILLEKKHQKTYLERLIAAKEASHFVELPQYTKAYRTILENAGYRFEVENTQTKTLSEGEVNFSIAIAHQVLDEAQGREPFFKAFLDFGQELRLGIIAYANWKRYYPHEQHIVPPQFHRDLTALQEFLLKQGLIQEKENHTVWTAGAPPEISSNDFREIFTQAYQVLLHTLYTR